MRRTPGEIVQQPPGDPGRRQRKVRSRTTVVHVLVVAGALVAMLGTALLPPGAGRLFVGTIALALVLAALAVLVRPR